MKSSVSRSIVFTSILVIAMLISAQIIWLYRIYQHEQKEFRTSVIKCMRSVYEELELLEISTIRMQKLVEQSESNTYIMKVHCIPGKDSLLNAVTQNLEDFGLFTDCNVVVFDKDQQKILYDAYLPGAGSILENVYKQQLPVRDYSYIMLYFPHVNRYIGNAMRWWIFSMSLILIVLIAFGFSMYYLYRQKFINEIQNDFIRNVTHEFQTPLTTITVGLDALSKPSVADHEAKRRKYIQLMQGQASYLKHHIENLMRVLQAESKGLVIDKVPVAPAQLLRKAIEQLSFSIEEKNAKVEWEREENVTIQADASTLYVALLNIVSNAIKYSVRPEVCVSVYSQNHHCVISVKDNGIGIAEKNLKQIFKKFFRVTHDDVHDVKGLGLGLYFTKKVIDGHGGNIKVHSIVGKGTEFIIEIPV